MNTVEQLEKAINEQKSISFNYKGEGIRIGNPHAVFSHATTNNITVDIYQIDGFSSDRQKIPDWRPFILKKIADIKILDLTFEIADGYNSNSEKYIKAFHKIK